MECNCVTVDEIVGLVTFVLLLAMFAYGVYKTATLSYRNGKMQERIRQLEEKAKDKDEFDITCDDSGL